MGFFQAKWKYLFFRACLLFVIMALFAIISVIFTLPVYIVLAVLALLLTVGVLFIIRPYLRADRLIRLYIEGYSLSAEEECIGMAISPATNLLLTQLQEIASPSKLFHMNKRQAQYFALQNQILRFE